MSHPTLTNPTRPRGLVMALALAWALSTPGRPDIVVLKNGNEIQGEVLTEDGGHVVVSFPGGVLRLRAKDVKEIRRQDRGVYLRQEAEKQLRRGDYEAAVETYTEALRVDEQSVRAQRGLITAQLGLARSMREIGRFADARRLLETLRSSEHAREEAARQLNLLDETLREARSQEEKAVARLSQGYVDEALGQLQDLFDRFPDRREEVGKHLASALVSKGDEHLREGDWENAAQRYLSAITVRPELLPEIRPRFVLSTQGRCRALLREGEFAAIEAVTREALEVAPTSEPMRFFHGLAHEGQGRPRVAAEEYLVVAGGRRPSNLESAVEDLRRRAERKLIESQQVEATAHPAAERVLAGDFRTAESRRFKARHKNLEIAREILTVSERTYDRLFRELGCKTHLRSRIQITVFPTHEDYTQAAADLTSWSAGSHRVQRRMGDLSLHEIACYQGQPGLLTETIPHEIAHSLLIHRLNYPERGIPLWANEGYAIVVEPDYVHQRYRRVVAQELIRRNLSPISTLTQRSTYPEEDVTTFYAQSFSLVEFLLDQKDLSTFVRLLQSVCGAGATLDTALQRHYDLRGVAALETRWRSWLRRGS